MFFSAQLHTLGQQNLSDAKGWPVGRAGMFFPVRNGRVDPSGNFCCAAPCRRLPPDTAAAIAEFLRPSPPQKRTSAAGPAHFPPYPTFLLSHLRAIPAWAGAGRRDSSLFEGGCDRSVTRVALNLPELDGALRFNFLALLVRVIGKTRPLLSDPQTPLNPTTCCTFELASCQFPPWRFSLFPRLRSPQWPRRNLPRLRRVPLP